MPNFTQIIKEALQFLGTKLDAIANKESLDNATFSEIKDQLKVIANKESLDNATFSEIKDQLKVIASKESVGPVNNINIPDTQKISIPGVSLITLKGDSPTDEHLIELITPLIPPPKEGNPGHTPTKSELKKIIQPLIPTKEDLTEIIKPLIPEPVVNTTVVAPTKEELTSIIKPLIPDPIPGSPDTGETIVEKINNDKSGKVIKKEHVEGLAEIESSVRTAEANSRLWLRAAGDTVYLADLSAQTDGVTKVFTIPQFRRAIMVTCSDFPSVLFSGNGFTAAGLTLTLTVSNAPSTGSQLGFLYVI